MVGQSYDICKHCNSSKAESKNGTKHHVHLDMCIK